MSKTYEITNGDETLTVNQKTIDGGILNRGFRLVNAPAQETVVPTDVLVEEEISTVERQVPKDVNAIMKEEPKPKAKPDFHYALTLDASDFDKYAAKFGCKLDGRKALNTLHQEFADFCGIDWVAPKVRVSDIPEDYLCPHCGTKARSKASYINNHGDKCHRNLKTK